MNIKYPIITSFQTFIHKSQTLKQAFSLLESHISSKKSPLKDGGVLWGRFDHFFFFRVRGRFDQIGDVFAWGRFDKGTF